VAGKKKEKQHLIYDGDNTVDNCDTDKEPLSIEERKLKKEALEQVIIRYVYFEESSKRDEKIWNIVKKRIQKYSVEKLHEIARELNMEDALENQIKQRNRAKLEKERLFRYLISHLDVDSIRAFVISRKQLARLDNISQKVDKIIQWRDRNKI